MIRVTIEVDGDARELLVSLARLLAQNGADVRGVVGAITADDIMDRVALRHRRALRRRHNRGGV
jgi:hypothetical protein